MKPQLMIVLLGMVLVPCIGLLATPPDDKTPTEENPLDQWALLKKPLEKKQLNDKKTVAEKAQQVLDVFEAIGGVAAQLIGAGAANPEPLEQQFAPQFGQLLTAELRFVRTICQPTPQQFQTIKTAGDAGLKVAVKKCARVQIQMQQGIRAGQPLEQPNPHEIISDALAKSVTQTLSAEQVKHYQLELAKRAAARKRAALLNLVAQLDQELVLTAEQRSLLTETLHTNWKDNWGHSLEVFLYGGQFIPVLPDDRVLPILNEAQKEIWKGIPKQHMSGVWMEFGLMQPGDFADDVEVLGAVETVTEKKNDDRKNDDRNMEGEPKRGEP